jgi:hypothetical protein
MFHSSSLSKEIIEANPEAIVISDGVDRGALGGQSDRVLTFQKAKGYNGLEEKDVYIIVTHLAPEKYEELNVIGQWLKEPAVVDLYYQDQIQRAVGRNRGFRQSEIRETHCVVIAGTRFAGVLEQKHGKSSTGRVTLKREKGRYW